MSCTVGDFVRHLDLPSFYPERCGFLLFIQRGVAFFLFREVWFTFFILEGVGFLLFIQRGVVFFFIQGGVLFREVCFYLFREVWFSFFREICFIDFSCM